MLFNYKCLCKCLLSDAGIICCVYLVYFLSFVAVLKYQSVVYSIPTVLHKTSFLVNLYWDNRYSDSDSDVRYFHHDLNM